MSRPPANIPHWKHRLCPVTDQLYLCGALPSGFEEAYAQLQEWVDAGVTDIVDVREEREDRDLVEQFQPHLKYHWLGVDDDGFERDDEWFESGLAVAAEVVADAGRRMVVHCEMGINRGPSMGFAMLLADGWSVTAAADAILDARPIAALLYAEDALRWWQRRNGVPAAHAALECADLHRWFHDNVDGADWIVERLVEWPA